MTHLHSVALQAVWESDQPWAPTPAPLRAGVGPGRAARALVRGVPHLAQVEWRGEMVEVSWKPRAFLLKNFLTEDEVTHLVSKVPPGRAGPRPRSARRAREAPP